MRISQEGTGDTKVCPRRKPTATLLNTCPALKKGHFPKLFTITTQSEKMVV